jgi:hypothetical protein
VLFITHDLDEAIAMSDRVVVLSAGPATHPIGEFAIDLPRPRDVAEVRTHPRFVELHTQIWAVLRDEVLKGYAQQLKKAGVSMGYVPTERTNAARLAGRGAGRDAAAGLAPGVAQPAGRVLHRRADAGGGPHLVAGSCPLPCGPTRCSPTGSKAADIYRHLGVTLLETVLAFGIGTLLGWPSASGWRWRRWPA